MKLQPLFDAVRDLPDNVLVNVDAYDNVLWYFDDENDLHINTDANRWDLEAGDGNTYAFEVRCMEISDDGFAMFYDADNGCGRTDTIVLRLEQRCRWED